MRLVIGNGAAKAIDDGVASLIAPAIATRNMFLAGRDDNIDAMATRLGVRRDYVAVLARLTYLSPEIVRAILVGQQPVELTPTRLVMLSRNRGVLRSRSRNELEAAAARKSKVPLQTRFNVMRAYATEAYRDGRGKLRPIPANATEPSVTVRRRLFLPAQE